MTVHSSWSCGCAQTLSGLDGMTYVCGRTTCVRTAERLPIYDPAADPLYDFRESRHVNESYWRQQQRAAQDRAARLLISPPMARVPGTDTYRPDPDVMRDALAVRRGGS